MGINCISNNSNDFVTLTWSQHGHVVMCTFWWLFPWVKQWNCGVMLCFIDACHSMVRLQHHTDSCRARCKWQLSGWIVSLPIRVHLHHAPAKEHYCSYLTVNNLKDTGKRQIYSRIAHKIQIQACIKQIPKFHSKREEGAGMYNGLERERSGSHFWHCGLPVQSCRGHHWEMT